MRRRSYSDSEELHRLQPSIYERRVIQHIDGEDDVRQYHSDVALVRPGVAGTWMDFVPPPHVPPLLPPAGVDALPSEGALTDWAARWWKRTDRPARALSPERYAHTLGLRQSSRDDRNQYVSVEGTPCRDEYYGSSMGLKGLLSSAEPSVLRGTARNLQSMLDRRAVDGNGGDPHTRHLTGAMLCEVQRLQTDVEPGAVDNRTRQMVRGTAAALELAADHKEGKVDGKTEDMMKSHVGRHLSSPDTNIWLQEALPFTAESDGRRHGRVAFGNEETYTRLDEVGNRWDEVQTQRHEQRLKDRAGLSSMNKWPTPGL